MKKKNRNAIIAASAVIIVSFANLFLFGCKSSNEAESDYVLVQSDLDQAVDTVQIGITGDTFDSLFAKNHDLKTSLNSSRDIFQNVIAGYGFSYYF